MILKEQCGAVGELAAFMDLVEAEGKRYGVTLEITDDRHRLAWLHRGRPPFPGWFPHGEGGAPGFWIDFQDRAGTTRATAGGLEYRIGLSLATMIDGGGMDATGHRIRLDGEAYDLAKEIRATAVGFSGNLWVGAAVDRGTGFSDWLTLTVPLLNKAIISALNPSTVTFITFVRDGQLAHLQARYRLPVMVPGVTWWRRFRGTEKLHLGVQTKDELLAAIRDPDSRSISVAGRPAA